MNWVFNQLDRLQKTINTWRGSSSATSSVNFSFERPEQVNDYVYQVHKPPGRPSVEIVFFHGLQLEGSGKEAYLTTWLSTEGSELWPKWILKDFPDARILLVSYDASAKRNDEQGTMDMYQTCENLVQSLTGEEANVGGDGCPVILVGHSIGCLVMKELCVNLDSTIHNSKESVQNLLRSVKGLFYYACPHHGSKLADKSTDLPKGPLFEGIRTLNKEAQRRNEEFRQLRLDYRWRTFGIGEGSPTTLGEFKDYVVPEASARYDVDGFYTCSSADHFNVCRPKYTTSSNFVELSRFIGSVLQQDRDLRCPKMCTPEGIYGLEGHVKVIEEKLKKGVRRLGIVGMGGIGKTTLAELIYRNISGSFEYTCFLRNVKKSMASKDNVQYLRKKIIRNLWRKGRKVKDTFNWETLKWKKVLIVLDDVKREPQVQVMLESDDFLDGSCVIATSREKRFLQLENFECHVVQKLGREDSKKLFYLNAFGSEEVDESVDKWCTEQFLKKCHGLPLALKIVGKYLHFQDKSVWADALQKMKNAESLDGDKEDGLYSILRVCYESLAKVEQEMFLDVATCFHDQDLEKVRQAWSACPWASPSSGLKNLEDKGLVTIEEHIIIEENRLSRQESIIRMHEVLRDLGRSIACPKTGNVGTHTRLCYDLSNPLPTAQLFNEGNAQVKVLIIHRCEDISLQWLHGLEELRILWLEDVSLHGPLDLLPANLAYLTITDSRLSIEPEGSHSRSIEAPEEREKKRQRLGQHSALKQLTINSCALLEGSLDSLGQFHALEHLEISSLSNWTAIPERLGELRALEDLRVVSCDQLEFIPHSLGHLVALKHLVIQGCQKVKAIPDSLGQLQALEHLVVSCGCLKAPLNVLRQLRALRHLETTCCQDWEKVMDLLAELEALENVAIHSCIDHDYPVIVQLQLLESFTTRRLLQGVGQVSLPMFDEDSVLEIIGWDSELLPDNFVGTGRVRRLLIKDCRNLKALPNTLKTFQKLEDFKIVNCRNLEALPDTIGELKALQSLSITSCKSLKSLPDTIKKLQALTYLLISCGSFTAPPNTLEQGKALRLEITWCRFRCWKKILDTLGQLHTLQTLVIPSCIHSSMTGQLDLLESLRRRRLLQGPGQVDLPIFHAESVSINIRKLKTIPNSFLRLGHASSLIIADSRNLTVIPDTLGDLQALRYLEISSRLHLNSRLSSLPDALGKLKALEHLEIQGCSTLEALPDSLGELQALQKLVLRRCEGLRVLPETLGKLEALKELHVEDCSTLEALPDSLGKLEALKELHVEDCSTLEALPDSLGELQALEKLILRGCKGLRVLPETLGKLEALKELHVKGCSTLEALPDSLGELQALEKLKLTWCEGLRVLPETLGKLEALKELYVDCSTLPDSLGELQALEKLKLRRCEGLRVLPETLVKLEALKELHVVCIALEALPDSLGELQALEKLELTWCEGLRVLPETLGKLEALKELYVGCSTLEAFPDSLGELQALEKLELTWCEGLRVLPETLGKLEALKELYVGCSTLEALPDSLGELQALEKLTLTRCEGLRVLPETLGKLEALKELHVEGCSTLEALPDSLGELQALEKLTLTRCEGLRVLPETLGKLEALKELHVEGCSTLEALPDSLGELQALHTLKIQFCG